MDTSKRNVFYKLISDYVLIVVYKGRVWYKRSSNAEEHKRGLHGRAHLYTMIIFTLLIRRKAL